MNNRDYWKKRFELLQEKQLEKGIDFYHELEKQYTLAAQAVEKEIISWYNRYATENKVSYTEAKRLLSSRELEGFRWSVEEYVKHGRANNPQFAEQLERASIKFHVSRLEALKLNIQQQIENVYGYELDGIDKLARDIYNTGYYHTAFEIQKGLKVGWGIGALDDNKVTKAISKPWAADGKNFSARIWNDREKLVQEIHTGLTQNLIRGGSPDELVKDIAKKFQTSKYNASRLVMTESAFFASASRLDSYKECGVEKYQIIETLDTLTCSLCGSLDNKILDISEYQIGATAPPFHPNCRGTDCAYFDDLPKSERAARNKKGKTYYVPDDMTYPEWKKQFIDNSPKDDIIRLPGFTQAVIPIKKFTEYALNPDKDPNKAKAFKDALGYELSDAQDLIDNIREHIKDFPALEKGKNPYGTLYEVLMELEGKNGKKANVKTGWILDDNTGETRLTSAYITKKGANKNDKN